MTRPDEPVPLSAPDLRGREAEYLARCVADNWVSTGGAFISEFESKVARIAGRRFAVATVNGTAALQLALMAAGVRPGDFVVVPDWTFAATANAVFHAGASPVFLDVTEESWTLDAMQLAACLDQFSEGRIGAVVAVDALGHPADMDAIGAVCRARGIPLIEDACGAIGARYKGRPAGGLGDLGVFSFNGNKTVTAGGGGMIVTDNGEWAETARHLSTQARRGPDYVHDAVGFNFRMTNLNAAVGIAQIERLEDLVAAKRSFAAAYDRTLAGRTSPTPMPRAPWAESSCWLYSVLCASEEAARGLVRHMERNGIEARIFWRQLSAQAPYADAPAEAAPVSRKLSGRVVSLPSSSGMTEGQLRRVIDALDRFAATQDAETGEDD